MKPFFRCFFFFQAAAYVTAAILMVSFIASMLFPNPLEKVLQWPVSPVILDKDGYVIHARLSSSQEWCLPIPLEDMGAWLPKVLVAVEDKRFFAHRGVDWLAIGRASAHNFFQGRVTSGASTITSQLIRISDPSPRTITSKIREFFLASFLETQLTKEQILELYLNRAPFGGPIRGVEAASRLYFSKRAKELSLGEAALLIGMLKGPTAYRPDKNPKKALARRQTIIRHIVNAGFIPSDMGALSLKEPLPLYNARMPQEAWHFSALAFSAEFGNSAVLFQQSLPEWDARKQQMTSAGVIRSTLDMRLQKLLEQTLQRQLVGYDEEITGAGVIINNKDASIVAYVGNSRFNLTRGKDWVDCGSAPRSPGSTLKPFVYLKAIEQGLIIPETLLADTPLRMGGQAPRNFDRLYRGPVTASAALARSLNVPAVRVHRKLGTASVLRLLHEAGFVSLPEGDRYGDSLVLGAGETTLLELGRAYTMLASLGIDRPLAWKTPSSMVENTLYLGTPASGLASSKSMNTSNTSTGARLYSEAASFLIAEILRDASRLPFVEQLTQVRENAPVAFKTGTSYGLRDAWAAAYSPEYTTIIWFGKAGGGANTQLTGIAMATPSAIHIIQSLRKNSLTAAWYTPPHALIKKRVCSLSGASPSIYCLSLKDAWVIPAVWRTTPCAMHVVREGLVQIAWPPELEDFQRKRVAAKDESRPVFINSPLANTSYIITPGGKGNPIPLRAEGAIYPIHWFIGDEYIGLQDEQQNPLYWIPKTGKHVVSLIDSREAVSSVTVEVIDLSGKKKANSLF